MIPLSEIEQCGVLSLATMDEESGVRRRQGEESRTVYSLRRTATNEKVASSAMR